MFCFHSDLDEHILAKSMELEEDCGMHRRATAGMRSVQSCAGTYCSGPAQVAVCGRIAATSSSMVAWNACLQLHGGLSKCSNMLLRICKEHLQLVVKVAMTSLGQFLTEVSCSL